MNCVELSAHYLKLAVYHARHAAGSFNSITLHSSIAD